MSVPSDRPFPPASGEQAKDLAKAAGKDATGDEADQDQKAVFETHKLGRSEFDSKFPKAKFAFSMSGIVLWKEIA